MRILDTNQFEVGYVFESEDIKQVITDEYVEFLKKAGYVNLAEKPRLFVARELLRLDEEVERVSKDLGTDDERRIFGINQENARELVNRLDGNLLPNGFMRRLVIPKIEYLAGQGIKQAKITYNEMEEIGEFLTDRIINRSQVRIGNEGKMLTLPEGYKRFDKVNDFGYPTTFTSEGRHGYYGPTQDENIVTRNGDSALSLSLSGIPPCTSRMIGVRYAKFFKEDRELKRK
ncbi:hypothetical protein J4476_00690 [Candidatus Woesearchaeota archaeon]|nr:MAG: hypothetical protein QT09_C0005G0047 [archaeon GW2011_AR18]MBS3161200.1 hypothetical protein [Candidatus Woesearchaeota archaeon]